jgi:TATA-box binding protein (TBP) (component of TFIID and TFIIIB)
MTSIKKKLVCNFKNHDFPNFDDIDVSTRTFTSSGNIKIKLDKLFDFLDVTPYSVVPKKRGRKKKVEQETKTVELNDGSIISLEFEGKIKGVRIKAKKQKKFFRNSLTVVMFIINKFINFKVCRNGTFQLTGCKTEEHAENCIKYIWKYMKNHQELYTIENDEKPYFLVIPSMRNIDFSLGFLVDREKLNQHMISKQDNLHCLLETSFGYTGLNIKIPLQEDITQLQIKKLVFKEGEWVENYTIYKEFLDYLPEKERKKKEYDRYNTFLVFQSGKVIHSGISNEYMKKSYYDFLDIINSCYENIEEKLDD